MEHGITNVVNLKGGITAWAEEIDSSMPIYCEEIIMVDNNENEIVTVYELKDMIDDQGNFILMDVRERRI